MNILRILVRTCIATLVCAGLAGCSSMAAEPQAAKMAVKSSDAEPAPETFDLTKIACWDVMTVDEEQRGVLLFLLYGYASGQSSKTLHTGQSIEKVLRETGKHCADNPDDSALDFMSKLL